MKKWIQLTLVFVSFFWAAPTQAEPKSYINPIYMTHIQEHYGQASTTGTHNFETEILTQNGDTMLYVFTWNGSKWVYLKHNDDCQMDPANSCPSIGVNSTFRSKVRVTINQWVNYRVVVLSYMVFSGSGTIARLSGNSHLKVQRPNESLTTVITNEFFGGDAVRVNDPNESGFSPFDPNNMYLYETVSKSYSSSFFQPVLIPTNCNREALGYQRGGGVGFQSRWSGNGACIVFVGDVEQGGLTQYDTEQGVDLIVNDALIAGRDQDADGLGLRLESAFGSCDRGEQILIQSPLRKCNSTTVGPEGNTVNKTHYFIELLFTSNNVAFLTERFLDTDGDGISDYEEVYGREMVYGFQDQNGVLLVLYDYVNLPKYGANPSIKDYFLQVDWFYGGSVPNNIPELLLLTNNLFTGSSATVIDFANAYINNPNGFPGIRLHFDVGFDPPVQSTHETKRLYGAWGLSNPGHATIGSMEHTYRNPIFPIGDPNSSKNPTFEQVAQLAQTRLHESRRGIFRYSYVYRSEFTDSGCGGTATVPGFVVRMAFGGLVSDIKESCKGVLAHELGHTVGLDHFGHEKWGNTHGNPLYQSVMNYNYSSAGFLEFQHGESIGVARSVLNPKHIIETQGIDGALSSLIFTSYPWNMKSVFLDSSSTSFKVDWNQSLTFDSQEIRHPVTLSLNNTSFGSDSDIGFGSANKQNIIGNVSGEVKSTKMIYVYPADTTGWTGLIIPRVYVFYVRDRVIRYKFATVTKTPNNNSSCPGGDQPVRFIGGVRQNADVCTSWSDEHSLMHIGGIDSLTAMYLPKIQGNNFQNIVLAYRDIVGRIQVIKSNKINFMDTQQNIPGTSTSVLPGQIVWDFHIIVSEGSAEGEPELVASGSNQGTPENISVYFRTKDFIGYPNNTFLFSQVITPNGHPWSFSTPSQVFDINGNSLEGGLSPSITWWPHVGAADGVLCGIFPEKTPINSVYPMRFFCQDSGSSWRDLTNFAFGESSVVSTAKMDLIYRFERKPDGSLLNSQNKLGRFWLFGLNENRNPYFLLSKIMNINMPPNIVASYGIFPFNYQDTFFDLSRYSFGARSAVSGSSISVLENLDLAGLKAVMFQEHNSSRSLLFFPFADGILDIPFTYDSDFKVMSRGICLGPRDSLPAGASVYTTQQWCGNAQNHIWGY